MGISRKIQRGMKPVRSDGYAASEMMRAISVCGSTEPSTRLMSLLSRFFWQPPFPCLQHQEHKHVESGDKHTV
jgi:hypothetical protein